MVLCSPSLRMPCSVIAKPFTLSTESMDPRYGNHVCLFIFCFKVVWCIYLSVHLSLFLFHCLPTFASLLPHRSLELFFATNQGPWGSEHLNNKSPRLSRKFSSPPPLTIPSRTSSPVHSRKLSLSSPVGGGKTGALDLSATTSFSAASSPTSTYNPVVSSPPPTCTKAPLDLSRGPTSPELAPTTPEDGGELPRIDAFCGKLRRSIRRGESHPHMCYPHIYTELPVY